MFCWLSMNPLACSHQCHYLSEFCTLDTVQEECLPGQLNMTVSGECMLSAAAWFMPDLIAMSAALLIQSLENIRDIMLPTYVVAVTALAFWPYFWHQPAVILCTYKAF